MPPTLPIYFKVTGEYFDVPYHMETPIYQLIEYVCRHSTLLSNNRPDDYYMVINNSDLLESHRTVEETGLDQPDRYKSLSVHLKTRMLIRQILESLQNLEQFRQIPVTKESHKMQQALCVDESNKISSSESLLTSNEVTSNEDNMNSEVHILMCGGPNVGKSSLINALCGCPVAKTNTIGLDSCTQKTSSYQLGNIYFWDTPGIQHWSHLDISSYLNSSTRCQIPICMFYCASPGSFTKLRQLEMLLEECIRQRHIFCALVVTNMFAHINRYAILDEFKTLLNQYVDNEQQIREQHGIWYYGTVGLCTMVNSIEYIDEDTNQRKPPQGTNELVLGIIKSLNDTHRLGSWLQTIEQNRQFWLDKQEELYKLTEKPYGTCLTEMI